MHARSAQKSTPATGKSSPPGWVTEATTTGVIESFTLLTQTCSRPELSQRTTGSTSRSAPRAPPVPTRPAAFRPAADFPPRRSRSSSRFAPSSKRRRPSSPLAPHAALHRLYRRARRPCARNRYTGLGRGLGGNPWSLPHHGCSRPSTRSPARGFSSSSDSNPPPADETHSGRFLAGQPPAPTRTAELARRICRAEPEQRGVPASSRGQIPAGICGRLGTSRSGFSRKDACLACEISATRRYMPPA